MGRQTSMRYVKNPPNNFYFPSEKVEPSIEDFVGLTVAEFEAMRLKHYISLNQKDSAENMNVSQPTFSRILDKAHQKVTQALIEGKDIRVYGGNINLKKGFNYSIDLAYFFHRKYAIAINYSRFLASNRIDNIYYEDMTTGQSGVGNIEDNIAISHISLGLTQRKVLGLGSALLIENI